MRAWTSQRFHSAQNLRFWVSAITGVIFVLTLLVSCRKEQSSSLPSLGSHERSPSPKPLRTLNAIEIGDEFFKLQGEERLGDIFDTVQYRYRTRNYTPLDIYVLSLANSESSVIDHLNQEAYFLQSSIPELEKRGIFDSAYPEYAREIHMDVNGSRLEGRQVLLRAKINKKDVRSLLVIFALDNKTAVKFRYTANLESFDAEEVLKFVNAWLSLRIKPQHIISQEFPVQPSAPASNKKDDIPKAWKDKLGSRFDGEVLGWYDSKKPGVFLTSEVLTDEDLTYATMVHELAHVKYDSNLESGSAELEKICSIYKVELAESDYLQWGKRELIADMVTLDMLAREKRPQAIQKYAVVRRIRREVVDPFLGASIEAMGSNEH